MDWCFTLHFVQCVATWRTLHICKNVIKHLDVCLRLYIHWCVHNYLCHYLLSFGRKRLDIARCFARSRKLSLPAWRQALGLVMSPSDLSMSHQLSQLLPLLAYQSACRLMPQPPYCALCRLVFRPSPVQGRDAASTPVSYLSHHPLFH